MDDFLSKLRKLEAETPEDPLGALVHIHAIQDRLAEMAMEASNEKWPGFKEFCERLFDRELALQGKAGDA
jgi:hypothetical protein